MPGSTIIGRVAVKVVPDTEKFRGETKAEIEAKAGDLEVKVPVVLDTKRVKKQLKQTLKLLNAYAEAHPIKIHAKLDTKDLAALRTQLLAETRDRQVDVDVNVDRNHLGDVARQLDSLVSRVEHKKINLDVQNDKGLDNALRGLERLTRHVRVQMDVDRTKSIRNFDGFLRFVHQRNMDKIKLDVDVDAKRNLDFLAGFRKLMGDQNINVDVDVKRSLLEAQREIHDFVRQHELERIQIQVDLDRQRSLNAMRRQFRSLGNDISQNMERATRPTQRDIDSLGRSMRRLTRWSTDWRRQMRGGAIDMDALDRRLSSAGRDMGLLASGSESARRGIVRLRDAMSGRKARIEGQWSDAARGIDYLGEAVDRNRRRWNLLGRSMDGVEQRLRRRTDHVPVINWVRPLNDADRAAGRLGRSMSRIVSAGRRLSEMNHTVDENGRRIGRLGRAYDRTATSIGRLFGRGARNNFFNLLGIMVEGAMRAPMALMNAFKLTFGNIIGGVGKMLSGNFKEGLAQAGKGAGALLGSLGGLVGVLVVLGAALGPVVALISALAAGLTAAVGALSIGLVGMLLPLIPIAVALAGALGVLIGAFSSVRTKGKFDDEFLKKFKKFDQLLDDIKKKFRSVAYDLAPTLSSLGSKMLGGLSGIITEFGSRIKFALQDLQFKLSDPMQSEFFKQWEEYLPGIFSSLANGVNSLALGLANFFAAILPQAKEMADGFENISNKFLDWTKSTEGQRSIRDFMADAWKKAKQLSSIITDLVAGIGKLLNTGSGSDMGGGFMDTLENTMRDFRSWADSNDAKKWFEDAKKAVQDFFAVLGDVIDLFKKLNNPKSKKNLDDILQAIQMVTGALNDMAPVIELGGALLSGVFTGASWAIQGLGAALGGIWTVISTIFDKGKLQDAMHQFWGKIGEGIMWALNQLGSFLNGVWNGLKEWITAPFKAAYMDLLGHSIIPDIVNGVISWLVRLPIMIFGALLGVPFAITGVFIQALTDLVGSVLPDLSSQVGSFFSSLPGMIPGWLADLPVFFGLSFSNLTSVLEGPFQTLGDWMGQAFQALVDMVPDWLKGLGGAIGKAFQAAIDSTPLGMAREGLKKVFGDMGNQASTELVNPFSNMPMTLGKETAKIPPAVSASIDPLGQVLGTAIAGASSSAMTGVGALSAKLTGNTGFGGIPGQIPGALAPMSATLSSEFSGLWSSASVGMGSFTTQVLGSFSAIAGQVPTALGRLGSAVSGAFGNMARYSVAAVSVMVTAVVSGFGQMRGATSQGFGNLANGAGRVASVVASRMTLMAQVSVRAVQAMAVAMGTYTAQGAGRMASAMVSGASRSVRAAQFTSRGVIGAVQGMGGAMHNAGWNAMIGFANGISSGGGVAIAQARAIANAVAAITRSALAVHSPSRVMMAIGRYVVAGLARGMEVSAQLALSAAHSVATSVADAMEGAFDMADQGKSAMQSLADGMVAGMKPVEAAMAGAAGLMDNGMTTGVTVSQGAAQTSLYAPGEQPQAVTDLAALLDGAELRMVGVDKAVLTTMKNNPVAVADASAVGTKKGRRR